MSYSRLTHENASKGVFQQNRFGFLEKLLLLKNKSDTQKHIQKQKKNTQKSFWI